MSANLSIICNAPPTCSLQTDMLALVSSPRPRALRKCRPNVSEFGARFQRATFENQYNAVALGLDRCRSVKKITFSDSRDVSRRAPPFSQWRIIKQTMRLPLKSLVTWSRHGDFLIDSHLLEVRTRLPKSGLLMIANDGRRFVSWKISRAFYNWPWH